jgi:diphosphomevalonate decarboxylase
MNATHQFICQHSVSSGQIKDGKCGWESPSNIALVKYWGKKENQIPANPSISFTLKNCVTRTTVSYAPAESFQFSIAVDGVLSLSFAPKIQTFIDRIIDYCPYLNQLSLSISTTNTFPHSSGIASSASGMSALALCICSIEQQLFGELTGHSFYHKASFLARLGSGSACRSLYPTVVSWGVHQNSNDSSDLYGSPLEKIHPVFANFQDTILLVDKGKKEVGSTEGHNLMHGHPFAQQRFDQAHHNLSALLEVLQTGDLEKFTAIVESEALTLHAMMMTSSPYFILMKPNTLQIIEKIWAFRKETGLHVLFTLGAGANVHLLYPQSEKEAVLKFIDKELKQHCQQESYLLDEVGSGPVQLV